MTRRAVTVEATVDEYLAWLLIERGASGETLREYRGTLGKLCDRFPRVDPRTIETSDLRHWIAEAWGPRVTARRRASVISQLHSFFGWLADEYQCADPSARIRRPRAASPRVARLSAEDVLRVVAEARRRGGRHRLVVEFLLGSGLRRSELVALTWGDIDVGRRPARVHVRRGKGGKARVVPIADTLAALLLEHRAAPTHRVLPGVGKGRHQPEDPQRPISPQAVWRLVKDVAVDAGVHDAELVGPHTLRAAFADAFLRAYPGHVEHLQALLGHASLATTQQYVQRLTLDRIEPLMQAFDPLSGRPLRDTQAHVEAGAGGFEPPNEQSRSAEPEEPNPQGHRDTPGGAS